MPSFRHVEKGCGGTLTWDPHQYQCMGTWGCESSVGVYFQVDANRSFLAHINACSEITDIYSVVCEKGCKDLRAQVKFNLEETAEEDEWNILDEHFGKNLILVCPFAEDVVDGGRTYMSTGGCVITQIREKFEEWAGELLRDRDRQIAAQQAGGDRHLSGDEMAYLDKVSADLTRNARRLESQAHTPVSTKHHGFIIDPPSRTATRFGDMSERGARPLLIELGPWIPSIERSILKEYWWLDATLDRDDDFPEWMVMEDDIATTPGGIAAENAKLDMMREGLAARQERMGSHGELRAYQTRFD